MSDNALRSENKGYNRGLILGFTMAESLLLVVFCLLLVAGAIISKERQHSRDVELDSARLEKQVEKDRKTIDDLNAKLVALTAMQPKSANDEFDKEWRKLVLAKEVMDQLLVKLAEPGPEKVAERVQSMLDKESDLSETQDERRRLEEQLVETRAKLADAEIKLHDQGLLLASAQKAAKPHDWPPIISLSEANGNYFQSGSAELESAFVAKLNGSLADEIAANLRNFGADIVEVIGHTDEQPLSRLGSNMDKNSIDVLSSKKTVNSLVPADNAGLGLARAISVANVLKANGALSGVTVLPLSAAQLILPGDILTVGQAGNVESRRRIEIRIRRREMPDVKQVQE
ncbi:hypothetical protein [Rhizobium leguminosarum]|uniref:hypothetical protein n=1 Tax=Rhizobium leguminosarum TaxID=384 RepID=UPI001C978ADB|nr:hypothetical protein [Rhizobium leguminosarum]MBY5439078.1 hypothetical protein [Rhizobium leguminosarum]